MDHRLRSVVCGCAVSLAAAIASGAAPPGAPASKPSDREARLAARQDGRLNQEAADLYKTADTTFLVGDPARAADLFQKILTAYPNSTYAVRAHARIGDCYHEMKKYPEAANHYRRAAAAGEASSNDEETAAGVRADFMVGQCYLQAKQYTPAFGALRKFIDHHPGHALVNVAYQLIGDAHLAMEQHQQALRAYRMVGTVIAEKTAAHRRIAPGQRLYLRVTDADVNVGETPRTVWATVKTTSGDVEVVELEPLGQRSPIFLATIPTALGAPRHSGELKAIFSEAIAVKIRADLTEADQLERTSAQKAEEALEADRGPQKMVNPAAAEKRRAALVAESQQIIAKAKALKAEACKTIDAAFAAFEKKVAAWAPEQALSNFPTTAPTTAPAEAEGAKPGETLESITAKALSGGSNDDEPLPPTTSTDAERRGMTENEILQVRRSAAQTPTGMETIDARLTTLSVWSRALQRQFQRLEVSGKDKIEIEYFDEVGPNGPNPKNTIRKDTVEVASDAVIDIMAPDGREPLPQIVLNSTITLRVEDFDADVSANADTVTVVLSAVPILDQRTAIPTTAPTTQRATPGEVDPTSVEAKKLPLVPEGAASVQVTLVETGPHTGVFTKSVKITDKALIGDNNAALPLKNEQTGNLYALRMAYVDARAIRNPDGWVIAKSVDTLADIAGDVSAVKYRQTPLDMEAKLKRAESAGEIGKIYLDLGLTRRGREHLSSAQTDCDEVARSGERGKLVEEALHRSWKIYFYAGLLDEAVGACRLLMSRYPNSDYIPEAMLSMGEASLALGQKQVTQDTASGAKPTLNRDLSRAISQFEDLVKRYPKSPKAAEALYKVGEAKMAGGQTGLDTFERLAKEYPDSILAAKGLTHVADYYRDIHDHRRAYEYYNRVLSDYPDAPALDRLLWEKGSCQKQLGLTAEMLQTFYRIVEEYSGTDYAAKAQKEIGFVNQKRGGKND